MEKFERSHRRLLVWKRSIELARVAYELTERFPKEERFGLTQQMRRSAVSVASNIAEGAGRRTTADKVHFFVMSRGSLMELETQFEIAKVLGFDVKDRGDVLEENVNHVSRLLSGLIESCRKELVL